MDEKNVEAHYKWKIDQGDYKLSHLSTRTHSKRNERKKIFKKVMWSIGYLLVVILVALLVFSK